MQLKSNKLSTTNMGNMNSIKSSNSQTVEMPIEECLDYMRRGSRVIKINYTTRKHHATKIIFLDEDKLAFRYSPTNKGNNFKIQISSIKEFECKTLHPNFIFKKHPVSHQFVVTYENSEGFSNKLGFVSFAADVAAIWIKGLEYLIQNEKPLSSERDPLYQKWLRDAFESVDKDQNGALSLHEIYKLFRLLNLHIGEDVIKEKFEECNVDGHSGVKQGKLIKKEFANFFKFFNKREEIPSLYNKYNDNDKHPWNLTQLKAFLEKEQLVVFDDKRCLRLMNECEPDVELRQKRLLSIEGLTELLFSNHNNILDNQRQDMTQPLSHYYINSSHNTYLMEDQLKGPSSVEAYVNALKMGCKCVELDCWDGSDNEPVVYHGHTFTSKILFKDVIEAIAKHAFVVSKYPLILSIENHCSCVQQGIMAKHLQGLLKDILFTGDVDHDLKHLPSPEQLIGKVLVKGKKLPAALAGVHLSNKEGEVTDDEDEAGEGMKEVMKDEDLCEKYELTSDVVSISSKDEDESLSPRSETGSFSPRSDNETSGGRGSSSGNHSDGKRKKKSKLKLAVEFSALVNYTESAPFKGFKVALEGQPCHKMSSLKESKFQNLAKKSPVDFINYNKKFLTRTYPNGSRVDSSNYNPITGWAVGCQIVALNFQTPGPMMDLVHGLFQLNNRAGYVLKPNFLRDESSSFNYEQTDQGSIQSRLVTIKIISAQLLPRTESSNKSITDPYVTLDVYGVNKDTITNKFKTKTVADNGFNPIWNEAFQFKLSIPALSFLRFAIYDNNIGYDEFIAQYTIPFSAVWPGYRRICLWDKQGHKIPNALLFVHILKN